MTTVSSPTPDPTPTNNVTPPVVIPVTALADLQVLKSGPANVFGGSNFTYIISVTNLGPSIATNIVITDTLPTNVTFVSAPRQCAGGRDRPLDAGLVVQRHRVDVCRDCYGARVWFLYQRRFWLRE